MKRHTHYDVFISYRREGADGTARLIYDWLKDDGYRVAFDLESLRNGEWDDQILEIIRKCKDVVVVLNPGALDRCVKWAKENPESVEIDENDWMRREIACALENRKNVIPIMLRDFNFPPSKTIPNDIRAISRQQAIEARTMKRLDGTIKELEGYLNAWPIRRITRKICLWSVNCVVAVGIASSVVSWQNSRRSHNTTKPDKEASNTVIVNPGYRQTTDNSGELSVVWDIGAPYPEGKWKHVHASPTEGQWEPDRGYRFSNSDPDDLTVVKNGIKQEMPFGIDCSFLSDQEKSGIVSNLFYSAMRDSTIIDIYEMNDEQQQFFNLLGKVFDNPALLQLIISKNQDAQSFAAFVEDFFNESLDSQNVDNDTKQRLRIMFLLFRPLCYGMDQFEATLNDIYDQTMKNERPVLYRGLLNEAWLEIPRWPAQKPAFTKRIDLSGLSFRDRLWLAIEILDAAQDSYIGMDFANADGSLSEESDAKTQYFSFETASNVMTLLSCFEEESPIPAISREEIDWKVLLASTNTICQIRGVIEAIFASANNQFSNLGSTIDAIANSCGRIRPSCLGKGRLRDLWEDIENGHFPQTPAKGETIPIEYFFKIDDDKKSVEVTRKRIKTEP